MDFCVKKCANGITGEVTLSGAKNAALPILAATLLCDEESVIGGVPDLVDIRALYDLLRYMGAGVEVKQDGVHVDPHGIKRLVAPYEIANSFRGSFLVAGPLIAKYGTAKVSMPGGCAIGVRPVDLHLKGLSAMGASIKQGKGYIEIKADRLQGKKLYLDFPSVGATENLMMAATLAEGQTILENAAVEPEIVDLANFLNKMGAHVQGGGSDTIKITGVEKLRGTTHNIIPDRIEAGTFMVLAGAVGGDLLISNAVPTHLRPVTAKLREMGVEIAEMEDAVRIIATGGFQPSDIKTMPYPGFPTDMQAQFMSMMSRLSGTSVVTETVFENRFMHACELQRMGANIKTEGRTAVIEGVKNLSGAKVKATDLRAAAALVIAGCIARGETIIEDIEHLQRGYEDFDAKLRRLGVDIQKR